MARSAALAAAIFGAALLVAAAVPGALAAECCESFSGEPYADCNCLEDGMERVDQHVDEGDYVNYHWRLTRWNLIDVPDEDRPTITFKASPCFGNTWLFVTPVVGPPFPTNETARWASRKESEDNAISSQIYYGEYFISVYGVAASNFSIVAVIEDDPTTDIDPIPGNNGTVAALPKIDQEEILFEGDLMAMLIQFVTTDQSDVEYMIYASRRHADERAGEACGVDAVKGDCIMSTACGLRDGPAVEKQTAWMVYDPDTLITTEIDGLEQNQEYTFNVVARMRNGNRTVAYTATIGEPIFTRVAQLNDDQTILIVALSVGGLFILLVGCIVWAKVRLNRAYQVRRFGRRGFQPVGPGDAKASS